MKLRKNRKEKYHNNKPYAVDEFDWFDIDFVVEQSTPNIFDRVMSFCFFFNSQYDNLW
jgi:hypothetical protein